MRHESTIVITIAAGTAALVVFRTLIELGLGGAGIWLFGSPLEYWFLAWFLIFGAVAVHVRQLEGHARERATVLRWWVAVAGLAGVLFVVGRIGLERLVLREGWAYSFASLCVIGLFGATSVARRAPSLRLPRHLGSDLRRLITRPLTWLFLAAIGYSAVLAPRSPNIPTRPDAFKRWYLRRPAQPVPASWKRAPVTLVELTDYQCPACRRVAGDYREALRNAALRHGGLFQHHKVDFPLENECNGYGTIGAPGGLHLAACEAAAAVRLARERGAAQEAAVIEWLYARQAELTPETVFDGIEQTFGIPVRARYHDVLPEIIREAADGRQLRVGSTPALFLNGRRLPNLSAEFLTAAIDAEVALVRANHGS